MKINRISIIANTIIEPDMSGGNRIFIECAKRWLDEGIAIDVLTSDVGEKLCRDNGLNKAKYVTWSSYRNLTDWVQSFSINWHIQGMFYHYDKLSSKELHNFKEF